MHRLLYLLLPLITTAQAGVAAAQVEGDHNAAGLGVAAAQVEGDQSAAGLVDFSVDPLGTSLRDYATTDAQELQGDFFLACMAGDVPEARNMLAQGARLDGEDGFGRRPLHLAAINARPELVAELLSLGADAEAVDSSGRTALDSVHLLLGEAEEEGDAPRFAELEAVRRALRQG